MTTHFIVLGSDEENEGGDLLYGHGEEVHVQVNGAPQSTAVTGSDLCMTALEAAMGIQSPRPNIPQSAVQDATLQDSPASSEKRFSVPASFTSQVIRQELASAHAALLADCSNASSATPSARHDAAPNPGSSSDYAVIHESRAEMQKQDGGPDLNGEVCQSLKNEHTMSNIPARKDNSADHPSYLPSRVQKTGKGKATPQRGLTAYGRLEKTIKAKERGLSEEAEKDIWEFNLLSQDPGVAKASALKGSAKRSISISKSSRAKRQDPVRDNDREVHEISEEDEEGWSGKEGWKGCKKTTPRKLISGRRSKTSGIIPVDDGIAGVEPAVYGDDENDDDYSPTRNSRKTKKKVTIDSPISSGKKTRSNTDDWELMPALPKGRKSTVLKQLRTGFEFGGEGMMLKAAAKTRTSTSASSPPNPPLSPFKVDLARDSLILPEEEKEKYHVFLPTATSPGGDGLLHDSSEELSSVKLPQLLSGPQGMSEPIAAKTGICMGPMILKEQYLGLKDKAGEETSTRHVQESERTLLSSVTPSTGKMKSKGNRSKTLAEILDIETGKDEENGEGVVNMDMSMGSSFQSSTRKRVRLKQARGKTVLATSSDKKESESNNNLTMPTSPAMLQRDPKKPRLVAASDDDSPLSELDEGVVMSPKRIIDNSGLMCSQPNKIHDQIILQKTNNLLDLSDSPKPKHPVPKARNRKRSGRNTSKIIFLNEDSTHDEDDLSAAEPQAQFTSRKPLAKRQKKSQAETTDANEQSPQHPALILGGTSSDKERSKKPDSLLSTIATKRKPSKTGKLETQHGKGNKIKKNGGGSTKQLNDQELGTKEGFGDSVLNEQDVGEPLYSQVSTSKEQSIGAGKEKSPPSTPVLREPVLARKQPETPQPAKPVIKQNPHSPINGGKPPPVKFRVGLSRRVNIEPLHGYLKK
ncbi:hypothetical protein EV426DRAFT_620668 [Tirmania nivea]|nr:hypothetical protein EV426DRAFT_620668 [Tirmania nivea]